MRLPAYRFLNCVYAWCLQHIHPEKVEEWLFNLNQPLPGHEEEVSDAMAEQEGADFMALMAQQGAR